MSGRKIALYAVLAALVAGPVLFFALGLQRYVDLDVVRAYRTDLNAFVAAHRVAAMAIYMLAYVAAVALSLPVGLVMTLTGGFLFGATMATVMIVIAATIGAMLLFLIARSTLGAALRAKAGPFLQKLEAGFRENAFSYLLGLRLMPLAPFAIVNLVPALLGVPLSTYVAATAIGIIPATFVYASFGAGLGQIFDEGGMVSVWAILTPGILAGLIGLAVLALIPVVIKTLRGRSL